MSISIIKQTEKYHKSSRIAIIKTKVVAIADTYKEALEIAYNLQTKEVKENIKYITGNIYK
jgi:hypothetical protein